MSEREQVLVRVVAAAHGMYREGVTVMFRPDGGNRIAKQVQIQNAIDAAASFNALGRALSDFGALGGVE